MKKIEIIETIQRNLAGGDVPADVQGQYAQEIVTLYVSMVYNKILWELVQMSYNMADSTPLDKFTKSFIVEDIKRDSVRKKYYIELPVNSVNVPWNEAIRYCGPPESEADGYWWRSPAANSVMGGLDVEMVDSHIRYFVENQRIYFHLMDAKIDNVMVKLLMPWEAWDDLDDINVPAGADSDLFVKVISMMRHADNRQDDTNDQAQDESGNNRVVPRTAK